MAAAYRPENCPIQLTHTFAFPRPDLPEVCHLVGPLVKRAQGKPGADCARSPMCVGVLQKCTRVKPQVQPGHPGFPRAMALRLIRALPGEAAFLAPVAGGTYHQRSA